MDVAWLLWKVRESHEHFITKLIFVSIPTSDFLRSGLLLIETNEPCHGAGFSLSIILSRWFFFNSVISNYGLMHRVSGGLALFKETYPEWLVTPEAKNSCSTSNPASSEEDGPEPGEVPLLGLGSLASLRIQDDPDTCDSSIGLDLDDVSIEFPSVSSFQFCMN